MFCTLGLRTPGRLNSGWLDALTLDGWMLGLWIRRFWTLGPRNFFPFLVTSNHFFLLFNAEFSNILNALGLMYYGSLERAPNIYNNSYLLQFVLQLKFPSEATNRSFIKRSAINFLGIHWSRKKFFFQNRGHIFWATSWTSLRKYIKV